MKRLIHWLDGEGLPPKQLTQQRAITQQKVVGWGGVASQAAHPAKGHHPAKSGWMGIAHQAAQQHHHTQHWYPDQASFIYKQRQQKDASPL